MSSKIGKFSLEFVLLVLIPLRLGVLELRDPAAWAPNWFPYLFFTISLFFLIYLPVEYLRRKKKPSDCAGRRRD